MRIHHIAMWTRQLEELRLFYEKFFGTTATPKYVNPGKRFESYFLSFQSGAKIELMRRPEVSEASDNTNFKNGYAHIAISLGSKESVDAKTEEIMAAGYVKLDGPRITGDGYYESTILDPDGNIIEITI